MGGFNSKVPPSLAAHRDPDGLCRCDTPSGAAGSQIPEDMLDVGRLCVPTVEHLWPERRGAGAGVVFAVLAAAHVFRQQQRLNARPISGGFVVWALDRLQWSSVSLSEVAALLREYGACSTYSDGQGLEMPSLSDLREAQNYPLVTGCQQDSSPSALRKALRCGNAVACTWFHRGHVRAVLSDGTVVRRVVPSHTRGLKGKADLAAACLVGYDRATDLFFGHAPAVTGAEGLVAFDSDFVQDFILDCLQVVLDEGSSIDRTSETTSTTAGEFEEVADDVCTNEDPIDESVKEDDESDLNAADWDQSTARNYE